MQIEEFAREQLPSLVRFAAVPAGDREPAEDVVHGLSSLRVQLEEGKESV